jgi:hypothetical protein
MHYLMFRFISSLRPHFVPQVVVPPLRMFCTSPPNGAVVPLDLISHQGSTPRDLMRSLSAEPCHSASLEYMAHDKLSGEAGAEFPHIVPPSARLTCASSSFRGIVCGPTMPFTNAAAGADRRIPLEVEPWRRYQLKW